ncbi:MAG: hypothetical protein P8I77_01550 [Bacteroidia bacterium]|jgi:hypothetical protein|nr:hypothetical protein [Bacteroidia bacterium]
MNVLFKNWNFARVARLIIGGSILIQGILNKDVAIILFGTFFMGLALFTTGCCGAANCSSRNTKETAVIDPNTIEVQYEEVK